MKLALWRLGSGLVALPAQVISLFLIFHGAPDAVGPLYRRLLPPSGRPRGRARTGAALFGALLLGVPVAAAMSGAALAMIDRLVGTIEYPFQVAGTPADPGATVAGRTVVHAALGALVVVGGDLVLRVGGYLLGRLVFPPLPADRPKEPADRPEDQPAPLRPPGGARRPSVPAGRRATPRTR